METKKWYTSKTVWLNILSTGAMILSQVQTLVILPASVIPIVGTVVAVLNIVLRTITNEPIKPIEKSVI